MRKSLSFSFIRDIRDRQWILLFSTIVGYFARRLLIEAKQVACLFEEHQTLSEIPTLGFSFTVCYCNIRRTFCRGRDSRCRSLIKSRQHSLVNMFVQPSNFISFSLACSKYFWSVLKDRWFLNCKRVHEKRFSQWDQISLDSNSIY